MKRDERQTTRGTHIYGPKRGKRDIMLKKKKKKGEDPKERFGEKIFNSVKKKKRKRKRKRNLWKFYLCFWLMFLVMYLCFWLI